MNRRYYRGNAALSYGACHSASIDPPEYPEPVEPTQEQWDRASQELADKEAGEFLACHAFIHDFAMQLYAKSKDFRESFDRYYADKIRERAIALAEAEAKRQAEADEYARYE